MYGRTAQGTPFRLPRNDPLLQYPSGELASATRSPLGFFDKECRDGALFPAHPIVHSQPPQINVNNTIDRLPVSVYYEIDITKGSAMDRREHDGLEIAARHRIQMQSGKWVVPSQVNKWKKYQVNLDGKPSCDCQDFELTGQACKHIYAARFTVEREYTEDESMVLIYLVHRDLSHFGILHNYYD